MKRGLKYRSTVYDKRMIRVINGRIIELYAGGSIDAIRLRGNKDFLHDLIDQGLSIDNAITAALEDTYKPLS